MVDEFKLGRKAPVLLPDASGGAGRTEPSAWLSLGGLTRQCQAGLSGLAPADAPSRSWIFSGSSMRVFLALGRRAGAPRPPSASRGAGPSGGRLRQRRALRLCSRLELPPWVRVFTEDLTHVVPQWPALSSLPLPRRAAAVAGRGGVA